MLQVCLLQVDDWEGEGGVGGGGGGGIVKGEVGEVQTGGGDIEELSTPKIKKYDITDDWVWWHQMSQIQALKIRLYELSLQKLDYRNQIT